MKKLFQSIKKFVGKLVEKIEKLWNRLDDEAKEHIGLIIKVTQAVKETIQEGTWTGAFLDAVILKIPGNLDDKALAWVRKYIPELLTKLTYANIIINAGTTEEQIYKAIDMIRVFDDTQKETFWDDFAKEFLKCTSDGILEWREVNYLVKFAFDKGYWLDQD